VALSVGFVNLVFLEISANSEWSAAIDALPLSMSKYLNKDYSTKLLTSSIVLYFVSLVLSVLATALALYRGLKGPDSSAAVEGGTQYNALLTNEHQQVPVVPPNTALEITIPEGMMPGMRFPVAIPDTSDVTIYTVPAGVRPGMRVLVPIQEAVPAAVYTPPLQEPTIQVVAQEAVVVGEAQISSELLAWFASFGVTNPACLQQLAPLIEQVGVTEPDELVDVADDEEAGATWIDEVVGILPLVKRKKFRQAIEDMRQNQK
jgi:hypothetical protein